MLREQHAGDEAECRDDASDVDDEARQTRRTAMRPNATGKTIVAIQIGTPAAMMSPAARSVDDEGEPADGEHRRRSRRRPCRR